MSNIVKQTQWSITSEVWDFSAEWGEKTVQYFVPTETASASRLSIYMQRFDNGWTSDYGISLEEGILGASSVLEIFSFNSSEISAALTWIHFDFDPRQFTNGTNYFFRFSQTGRSGISITETPKIRTAVQAGGSVYAGGIRYERTNISGTWSARPNEDHTFIVGDGLPNKPINPTPSDTNTNIVLLPTLSWQAG